MKRNFIVQISNMYLNEFIFYWVYYEQPCALLLLKPKEEGLTGIKLTIESPEAETFLNRAKEKIGFILHEVN